ncbi:hypothetical protein DB30_02138 [Enhygromyxa salina]|uniref:Uncharacterized protein n=1 Tax=Enhygromyxa salina TaxID=215803 RepID=A0A0C2CQM3_9BACT|nr:hypothetical protein DB30_02138 [Enhygromyxa salina]
MARQRATSSDPPAGHWFPRRPSRPRGSSEAKLDEVIAALGSMDLHMNQGLAPVGPPKRG